MAMGKRPGERPSLRRTRRFAVSVALVLLAVACRGGDGSASNGTAVGSEEGEPAAEVETPDETDSEDDEDPPAGETTDSDTDTRAARSGGTTNAGTTDEGNGTDSATGGGRSVISWIIGLGPSAPSGPSAFRAYEMLVSGRCSEVGAGFDDGSLDLGAASEALYRGTAAACLAAIEGQQGRWSDAEAAAQTAGSGDGGCLDRAVRRLLDGLLEAHRADPAASFERGRDAGTAIAPPCPSISRLSPDHGPNGTAVRISGAHLDTAGLEVRLDARPGLGEFVGEAVRDGQDLVVPIAVPDGVTTVCVALHTIPNWYADGAVFVVEPPVNSAPDEGTADGDGDDDGDRPATEDGDRPADDEGDRPADGQDDEDHEDDGLSLATTRLASADGSCPPEQ